MSYPSSSQPSNRRSHHHHRQLAQHDAQLAAILQQSAADYRREQITRFEQGIEITVPTLPMSSIPDTIIKQYPDIPIDTSVGSDYILLPQRFANILCPDINSNFNIGLTIFKICLDTPSTHIPYYITLKGYIIGSEQDYAYIDSTIFQHLDIFPGQSINLKTIPHNQLSIGTRVVLKPRTSLLFLDIKDQCKLLEGQLGINYRILYPDQVINVFSQELGCQLTLDVINLFNENIASDDTFYPANGPVIITDTNLEVDFQISQEDIANYNAIHTPAQPDPAIFPRKQFRIRGILPQYIEKYIDELKAKCLSSPITNINNNYIGSVGRMLNDNITASVLKGTR